MHDIHTRAWRERNEVIKSKLNNSKHYLSRVAFRGAKELAS